MLATTTNACAAVGARPVAFAGHRNLLIWDEESGIEHFVRDASFGSNAELAFIAPTPSFPQLSETEPNCLRRLDAIFPNGSGGSLGAGRSSDANGVQIVAVREVAGYQATTLTADAPSALGDWLRANGFPDPDWAENWALPYLRRNWYLTVFKLERRASAKTGVRTGPVRMTFQTKKAFNPYAVPHENAGHGGLQLDLLSKVPLHGYIGDADYRPRSQRASSVKPELLKDLATDLHLVPEALKGFDHAVRFLDHEFGTEEKDDIFFTPMLDALGIWRFDFLAKLGGSSDFPVRL